MSERRETTIGFSKRPDRLPWTVYASLALLWLMIFALVLAVTW